MKSSLIWLLEGGAIPALLCISGLFFLFYLKATPSGRLAGWCAP